MNGMTSRVAFPVAAAVLFVLGGASLGVAAPGDAERAPKSPDTMVKEAKGVVVQAETASRNIGRMLRAARREKDVVKTLCLDDKLSQVEVAKRTAAERVESLELAVRSGNTDRVDHDFAVIGALSERTVALTAEANQCIGEEKGEISGSKLNVKFGASIPKSDTAAVPIAPNLSAPPQAASPTT
jgi:hypothetical protein